MIDPSFLAAGVSSGVSTAGLIIVPVSLFLIGLLVAGVKGVIAFTKYLVKSQESQSSTASSNLRIEQSLARYAESNDSRVNGIEQDVAVLNALVLPTNGKTSRVPPRQPEEK